MKIKKSKMLTISDIEIKKTGLTELELRVEIAVMLYVQNRFTLGQAAEFAGISQWEMQKIIGDRGIFVHYDVAEFHEDLKNLGIEYK